MLNAPAVKDPGVSVNHVIRIPDGALFGIAYSRHIVQIYSYHGGDDVQEHLEIDAHVGGVNDLAFSHPNEQLCVITCGDDKTIKVRDATTGAKQYTFEGHQAPVYSVCPHYKENIQFIFSIALDGKIKAWEYDNLGCRVDYDAPGRWCTTMAYSADGTRLVYLAQSFLFPFAGWANYIVIYFFLLFFFGGGLQAIFMWDK
ncbi:topless-related protein 1-like [Pyrus ussuriensis x Pyrus communis]|uniref:Topless-related protein 1-like n=1 Tax=Pyrus ussuriensis x Pyrus communis TaxID=2448454 RepID=A0A5N5G822_9ROSA|nr:topless-related protein 1-like [Pyrus ussuriensis x Pyrus communis]